MKKSILLYEALQEYDYWLKYFFAGFLSLHLIMGVVSISQDIEAAIAMFGITLFDAIVFKAVMPRRFQIFGA